MATWGRQYSDIVKVLFLCICWYLTSSTNNVIGKTVLTDFPYPMTVTVIQLISVVTYSQPLLILRDIQSPKLSWGYYNKLIIPLALGKFLATFSGQVSIWKVPVSYAHTVKATMPFFTVVLSRILMGEKQTTMVYLSLFPIIGGVLIATLTELSFDMIGLITALTATIGFSLQYIFSKKVLQDTGAHQFWLLYILAKLALFMFLPFWLYFDVITITKDTILTDPDKVWKVLVLLMLDGFLNWLQNILAFTMLSMVTPLTYAVANCSKRICIISVSLILLKNPVTSTNLFGMMLAVLGVFTYNKAKYDANQAAKRQAILPMTDKTGTPYMNGIHHTKSPYKNGVYQNGISNGHTVFKL